MDVACESNGRFVGDVCGRTRDRGEGRKRLGLGSRASYEPRGDGGSKSTRGEVSHKD